MSETSVVRGTAVADAERPPAAPLLEVEDLVVDLSVEGAMRTVLHQV